MDPETAVFIRFAIAVMGLTMATSGAWSAWGGEVAMVVLGAGIFLAILAK